MATISAVVITKNEQGNIKDCLKSLAFVDEIVVVDDYSTDRTATIAKKFTDQVFLRKLDTLGGQKRFAVSKTSGQWILLVDADERIPPALAREIQIAVRSPLFDAYNFYFASFLFSRALRPTLSGGQVLLFRKNKGRIISDNIHERVEVNGKVGQLKNPILHYSYPSVYEMIEKFNRYTGPEAMLTFERGERSSILKIIFTIPRVFFWRYLISGEWRDGKRGFVLSAMFGIYHLLVMLKLFEIESKKGSGRFSSVKYIPK